MSSNINTVCGERCCDPTNYAHQHLTASSINLSTLGEDWFVFAVVHISQQAGHFAG
jgi:hypothetical protein